jgi:hypothetical protein
MPKKYRTSKGYSGTFGPLLLSWLLLSQYPAAQVQADTIYRWKDTAGVTHFSGSPPPPEATDHRTLELAPGPSTPGEGLRDGERTALRAVERELARQHRAAQQARRRNDHAVAERRRMCQERRTRLRGTGYHATRKADTVFLRRNCW